MASSVPSMYWSTTQAHWPRSPRSPRPMPTTGGSTSRRACAARSTAPAPSSPGCWNAGTERSSTFRATPRFVRARTRAATRVHRRAHEARADREDDEALARGLGCERLGQVEQGRLRTSRGASSAAAAVRAMSSMCTIGRQGVTGLSGACSVTNSSPETPYIEHDRGEDEAADARLARRSGQAHARALVDLERQLRVEVVERVRWRERPGGRSRRSCAGRPRRDRGCRAARSRPRRRGTGRSRVVVRADAGHLVPCAARNGAATEPM